MSERHPLPTAPSASFRRKGPLEAAGELIGQSSVAPRARTWLKRLYHALLMLQTGGRGLRSALPHGEVVYVHPAHRFMSWNPAEYEAFRSTVRPGTVALDVGANVGSYSVLLGQWVGVGGRVYAFEPAPDVFDGLTRHIALNHLQHVVCAVAAAVADRDGIARLTISPTAGESRLTALAARGERLAAFDGRCIPADYVAPRSNTPGILGRRALPAGRIVALGATIDLHHGLLGWRLQ